MKKLNSEEESRYVLDTILVHKDPEFLVLKDQIRMLELPYK